MTKYTYLRLLISVIAAILLVVRLIWPNLQVDLAVIILAVLIILPWLTPLIESAELPGVGTIKFRQVEEAGKQLDTEIVMETVAPQVSAYPKPSFLAVADRDPNLALVGFRIEVEKRLRALALKHGLNDKQTNRHLIDELERQFVLNTSSANGLRSIIDAGNKAAHGAKVESEIAIWAFDKGITILASIDAKLAEGEVEDIGEWLNKATTIIQFEGEEFGEHCATILNLAKREGFVRLDLGFSSTKAKAGDILVRLGALEIDQNQTSTRFPTHFHLTHLGNSLLSHLAVIQ